VTACVYIASYSIIQFIGYNPNNSDARFAQRYRDMVGDPSVKDTIGWLDKVSSGAVNLSIEVDSTPNVSEGAPVVSTSVQRGWTEDVLGNKNTTFI
ncbi:MAG: hypothetical protein V3R81_04340, partial [Gammaproteobacteria bacterium]